MAKSCINWSQRYIVLNHVRLLTCVCCLVLLQVVSVHEKVNVFTSVQRTFD